MVDQGTGSALSSRSLCRMEKIAAAKAMGWNLELDRGLRAAKPGAQWEAIMKLGPRLQQWSQEPPVSAVTASLFELDPGQDRAFANAILLRLVDTFRTGNNFTRLCILKIFLLEMKNRKYCMRSGKSFYKSMLSKERIPSHVEVLKRVKSVMDSGDMVGRALALRVIGCLADFAVDSADTHCMVFDALNSSHQQEVNAALFVISCLSKLSESFSSLALEKLVYIVDAMETPPETRMRSIHVFASMYNSTIVALKAHKLGKSLMLKVPTDEVVTTMLVALSKLAFKSTIILADQVDLLLSYLSSDPRAIIRAVSLKCLIRVAEKAIRCIPLERMGFRILISIIEDIKMPSGLQKLAFLALRKLSPCYVTKVDTEQLLKLLSLVELKALHPSWSRVQPALNLLVDLACQIQRLRKSVWKSATDAVPLLGVVANPAGKDSIKMDYVTRIALVLCDHVALAVCCSHDEDLQGGKQEWCSHCDYNTLSKKRCRFTLNLLLKLIESCHQANFVIVDCLVGMVEALLKKIQQIPHRDQQQDVENSSIGKIGIHVETASCKTMDCMDLQSNSQLEIQTPDSRTFKLWLLKMLCLFLRNVADIMELKEEDFYKIFIRLTHLVSNESDVLYHVTSPLLPILFKAVVYICPDEAHKIAEKVSYLAEHEIKRGDYWAAYKISLQSAVHGLWVQSAFVLNLIADKVQSEGCYFWLRALALLCQSEANIQSESQKAVSFRKRGESALSISKQENHPYSAFNLGAALAKAIPQLRSAGRSLAAAVNLDRTFEFQRWFLVLRIALLESAGQLLGLLEPICVDLNGSGIQMLNNTVISSVTNSTWEIADDACRKQTISSIEGVVRKCEVFSLQFQKLATEFDILSISFMDMDKESLQILSFAALGCSLLAFCTSFAFNYFKSGNEMPADALCALVVADLYQRLELWSNEDWSELLLLTLQLGQVHTSSLKVKWNSSLIPSWKNLLHLMRWAVKEVMNLQEEAVMDNGKSLCQIQARGIYVLKYVVEKWLCLPWTLPKYFHCCRPRIGVEFLIRRIDKGDLEELTVSKGVTLPLSLCLQVRNLHHGGVCKVKSVCCALLLRSAEKSIAVDEEFYSGWRVGWYEDQIMEGVSHLSLIEELFLRLRERNLTPRERLWKRSVPSVKNIVLSDIDEGGQGFTSCLLNTVGLPCGQFRISLQVACVDNEGYEWMLPPMNAGPFLRII